MQDLSILDFGDGNEFKIVDPNAPRKGDIHDSMIEIYQGGKNKGSFSLNQSENGRIDLDEGGSDISFSLDSTGTGLTIKKGGTPPTPPVETKTYRIYTTSVGGNDASIAIDDGSSVTEYVYYDCNDKINIDDNFEFDYGITNSLSWTFISKSDSLYLDDVKINQNTEIKNWFYDYSVDFIIEIR